ncbi:MAG TPA: maleylacetoacetate isomerase [Myxococcota bacterium]|nr:maleylacetoacetate isomerase [Myxococcota bacterium]
MLELHDYWRSSASYRVRIALEWKRLPFKRAPVHLLRDGGQQYAPAYRKLNPQAIVPTLVDGELVIPQSLAILEYLEEVHPEPPLLPRDAAGRARVRSLALAIACETHPLQNTRVVAHLGERFGANDEAKAAWNRHFIELGLGAVEQRLASEPATGRFCHGDAPTFADLCLVPQLYNAVRWGCDLSGMPTLVRVRDECLALEAFQRAMPEAVQTEAG